MTDNPIPQIHIERDLEAVNARLEEVTQKMAQRARAAAVAEHEYRSAFAVAFARHRANGSAIEEAKQLATIDCDRLLLERLVTDATVEAAKEAGRNARAQGENLRSLNANHRSLVVGS